MKHKQLTMLNISDMLSPDARAVVASLFSYEFINVYSRRLPSQLFYAFKDHIYDV